MIISFVIPVYNESKRIGKTAREIVYFQKQFPHPSEWIFVDDGSVDNTRQQAAAELGSLPHHWIALGTNQGKGRAVQQGVLAAKGDCIFFMDADLSTPLTEYQKLLSALDSGNDVAIGSRGPGAQILVRQNPLREMMGRTFNQIARFFTFKGIRDSQCGFKAFRKDAAHRLFSLQKITRFSFDAEILYLAQVLGYRIAEVPVTWLNSKESRVRIFSDSIQMFLDLLRIRWLHRNLKSESNR